MNRIGWGFVGEGVVLFLFITTPAMQQPRGQFFTVQQCSHLEFNKHFCCHTLNHLSSFVLYAQSNIYSQMLYTTKCCLGAARISYSGSKDV